MPACHASRIDGRQLQAALENICGDGDEEAPLADRGCHAPRSTVRLKESTQDDDDIPMPVAEPVHCDSKKAELELKSSLEKVRGVRADVDSHHPALPPPEMGANLDVEFAAKLQHSLAEQAEKKKAEENVHYPPPPTGKVDMDFAAQLQRQLALKSEFEAQASHHPQTSNGKVDGNFAAELQHKLAGRHDAEDVRTAHHVSDFPHAVFEPASSSKSQGVSSGEPQADSPTKAKSAKFACFGEEDDFSRQLHNQLQSKLKANGQDGGGDDLARMLQAKLAGEKNAVIEAAMDAASVTMPPAGSGFGLDVEEDAVVTAGTQAPHTTAVLTAAQLAALDDEDDDAEAQERNGEIVAYPPKQANDVKSHEEPSAPVFHADDEESTVIDRGAKAPPTTMVLDSAQLALSNDELMDRGEGDEVGDVNVIERGLKAPHTTAVLSGAQLAMLDDEDEDEAKRVASNAYDPFRSGLGGGQAELDDQVIPKGLQAPHTTAVLSSAQLAQLSDEEDEKPRAEDPVLPKTAGISTADVAKLDGAAGVEDTAFETGFKAPPGTCMTSPSHFATMSVDEVELPMVNAAPDRAPAPPPTAVPSIEQRSVAEALQPQFATQQAVPATLPAPAQAPVAAPPVTDGHSVHAMAQAASKLGLANLTTDQLKNENQKLASEIEALRAEIAQRRLEANLPDAAPASSNWRANMATAGVGAYA